jgi:hypothetical protein
MEIFKKEWGPEDDPDGTIINATILDDGSLKIDGTDYGKSARGFSGGDDYEYGLQISADDLPAFTLELLKRSFNLRGRISFSTIKKICKNAGITVQDWYF